MIPEPQKLMLMETVDGLLKSWWTIVAGVCIGAALAIVAVRHAPVIFEASTVILADAERLPDEFIQPTVSSVDGIELKLKELRSAVLTEENLASVVAEVYPRATTPERQLELTSLIAFRTQVSYFPRTKSIELSYVDSSAERAAIIVNEIADLFVSENVHLRAKDAALLTDSLERLGVQLQVEMDTFKKELERIRREHPYESEDHRSANENVVQEADEQLERTRTAIGLAEQRLSGLEAQQAYANSVGTDIEERWETPDEGVGASDPRVIALREEIASLKHRYRSDHPTVKSKQRELEDILRSLAPPDEGPDSTESESTSPAHPSLDIWETQIRAAKLELRRLQDQERESERTLRTYRTYLANTPAIQREIDDLVSRISVKRGELLNHETKIAQSKFGERIEEEDLGNPFVKPYDAVPPFQPISPDPIQFLVIGIAAGLALFVGPVLIKTFLMPTVGSELALRNLAEIPVLVSIPVMVTPQIQRLRRLRWIRNFAFSGISAVMLAAVVSLDRIGIL